MLGFNSELAATQQTYYSVPIRALLLLYSILQPAIGRWLLKGGHILIPGTCEYMPFFFFLINQGLRLSRDVGLI